MRGRHQRVTPRTHRSITSDAADPRRNSRDRRAHRSGVGLITVLRIRTDAPSERIDAHEPHPAVQSHDEEDGSFATHYLAARSGDGARHLLQMLVRNSSDLICVLDKNAEIVFANPAAGRTLGFDSLSEVSAVVFDLVHPDDRAAAAEAFSRVYADPREHLRQTFRVRRSNGEWCFLEVTATNCIEDPGIEGIILNARDISDAENLFRALTTFGEANQALVHTTDEPSLLQEICDTIVDAGGYQLAWVGYLEAPDDLVAVAAAGATECLEHVGDDTDPDAPREMVRRASRTGQIETSHVTTECLGDPSDAHSSARHGFATSCAIPLRVGGQIVGVLAIHAQEPGAFGPAEIRLLSQVGDALSYGIGRLRDAASLHSSESRFRTLAAAAPIGILEMSVDGQVHFANPQVADIAGGEVESFLGVGWISSVHPDDVTGIQALLRRAANSPLARPVTTTFRLRRPDGRTRSVRAVASPQSDGPSGGFVVLLEDVTDELEAQAQLTRQAFYDTVTGLPNRALFLDRLSAGSEPSSWAQPRRGPVHGPGPVQVRQRLAGAQRGRRRAARRGRAFRPDDARRRDRGALQRRRVHLHPPRRAQRGRGDGDGESTAQRARRADPARRPGARHHGQRRHRDATSRRGRRDGPARRRHRDVRGQARRGGTAASSSTSGSASAPWTG